MTGRLTTEMSRRHGNRKSFVRVRPVSQVLLAIRSENAIETHQRVRREVVKWLDEHSSIPLPEQAWSGASFELEGVQVQRTAALAFVNTSRYWAAFLDDDDHAIARRTWTTEIGLAIKDNQTVLLGSRLICATRGEDPRFDRSIPRFIRNVVRKQTAFFDGGMPLKTRPDVIENDDDVLSLIRLLLSKKRKAPVIVFSLPDEETNPLRTAGSAQDVHNRSLGAAHVKIITGPASRKLTQQIGKQYAVYNQAVRTYQPRFLLHEDEPARHPLALPDRIYDWKERWGVTFEQFLVNQAFARTVSVPGYEDRVPSFTHVKRVFSEQQMAQARHDKVPDDVLLRLSGDESRALKDQLTEQQELYDGLLAVAEEEKADALKESNETYDALLAISEDERKKAENLYLELKSQNLHLRSRIDQLQEQITTTSGKQEESIPTDLDGFKNWCSTALAGEVELLSRAYRGIKKSEYENVALIYESLLLLRDYYIPMRTIGDIAHKNAYEEKCSALGLVESASLSNGQYSREDDTYIVMYEGRKKTLDRHLKKGTSREPRNCFRLYFFWDDEYQRVVVGWLPSHLHTRAS